MFYLPAKHSKNSKGRDYCHETADYDQGVRRGAEVSDFSFPQKRVPKFFAKSLSDAGEKNKKD